MPSLPEPGLRLPAASPRLMQNFTWRYYYSGQFPFAKRTVQHVRWRRFSAALALLRSLPHPRLMVDVGCGPGESTLYLARALCAAEAVGVDLSRDGCWFAVELARANDLIARFVAGSAAQLPFCAESADLVVSFELIEHLPNWKAFLNECWRVLRPGGHLLVTTPNPKSIHAWLKSAYGRIKSFDRLNRNWQKDGDFFEVFISGSKLGRALEECGFACQVWRPVGFVLTVQPDWTLAPTRVLEDLAERMPGVRRLAVSTVVLAVRRPVVSPT